MLMRTLPRWIAVDPGYRHDQMVLDFVYGAHNTDLLSSDLVIDIYWEALWRAGMIFRADRPIKVEFTAV